MNKNNPKTYRTVYDIHRIYVLFFMFLLTNVCCFQAIAQNEKIAQLAEKADSLNNQDAHKAILTLLNPTIETIVPKSTTDSLHLAKLYYYQFQGNFYTGKYLESVQSTTKGIPFCVDTDEGNYTKGILHYKRAYGESELGFSRRAMKNMKIAIDHFSEDNQKSLDYLVDAHVFLSSRAAYHGNLEDAKYYIRLAENIYRRHKAYLDKARTDSAGNYDRYEVILKYRKIYLLYKLSKSKADSLELVKTVKELETLHRQPSFNKQERIYYSTAMNHVGDWYIAHKPDSLINAEDLRLGNQYLDKSIEFIENKNYPGDPFTFKYNKCKALTKANQLAEAEKLINELLQKLAATDGRFPYFLAQKALIEAKLKRKETALAIFHNVIEHIHSDTTTLATDYRNFKPSRSYGHARLIRRVAEKLETFYGSDSEIQKKIAKLYYIAFVQFENSYARTKFSPGQNERLREILHGVLTTSAPNSLEHITANELLGKTETIMNQMSWQRFYQNRYTNALPLLDSLNYTHLKLRTQLAAAKRANHIRITDSLQERINKHLAYTNEQFPNLALLSEKIFQIETLQQQLSADELVLKYFILRDKIALFSITNANIRWELRPWTQTEIALTENLIESIKHRNFNENAATVLAQKLLPNIDENISKIIINPDGELYRIPFETLFNEQQFLAERYKIRYTSNLRFIHFENNPEKKNQEETVAIYAPSYKGEPSKFTTRNEASYLKGAQHEAKLISQLFASKTYIGNNISKQSFIETAPKATMLHLAMHAEINNEQPGLSRLLFSNNKNSEDDLYLEELYALRLQADLAVLSACNTGIGKENPGRNLASFQRAFTFSGVPATVVSLWEVPDRSTGEIMEAFYANLKAGNTKSEALRKAKLTYFTKHKGTKLAQPYYWTGFVLYGDESAVQIPATSKIWWFVAAFCVILFLIFLLYKRAKRKNTVTNSF